MLEIALHRCNSPPSILKKLLVLDVQTTYMLSETGLVFIDRLYGEFGFMFQILLNLVEVLGTYSRTRCTLYVSARMVCSGTAEAAHCVGVAG